VYRKQTKELTETPPGVEIRHGRRVSSLRIRFYYKNVECRETLKLKPTKSNIKYVQRLRCEILNSIERGTFNYADYFPNSKNAKKFGHARGNITIDKLLTDFFDQAEKTLQPSTVIGYRKYANAHLFPKFGNLFIKDLTPKMLREWISSLNVTSKTISHILTPLRAVIDRALNDDLIDKNPLDRVKVNRIINKNTARSAFEVDPFTTEEIESILKSANGQIRNLLQFAFFSGLRTSELIALNWGDIDLNKKTANITRAFVCGEFKATKTESGNRILLLLPPAIQALQAQKKHTFLTKDRVFHNPDTNEPWVDNEQIRLKAWIPIIKAAKVKYRNPYQTRHTFASMMLSSGENMLWVAKQMGHRNIKVLLKHYARWIPDSNSINGYTPINNWDVIK